MNLLDSTTISAGESAMTDIFDTFARTQQVRFYKVQTETLVVEDSTYISDFYQDPPYSGVISSGNYQDFPARIWYMDKIQSLDYIAGGEDTQIRAKQLYGKVKMMVGSGAFTYLRDSERFTFLDGKYQIDETWRGVGIFGNINYYTIVLSRVL